MITKEVKQFIPRVGMTSLVGIGIRGPEDFPLSFGNYMSISEGPYLINMWAENLDEWRRRNPNVDTIEITILSDGKHSLGIVTDERLEDWINDKTCVTGHGWGSRELCEAAHEFLGKDVGNSVCGCEKLDQWSSISKKWGGGSNIVEYHCHNCNRHWEVSRG